MTGELTEERFCVHIIPHCRIVFGKSIRARGYARIDWLVAYMLAHAHFEILTGYN